MLYPIYIVLGFLPSLIWLSFYLRKDKQPEPNSMVVRVFIWGMLLAPLAIVLELLLIWLINPTANPFSTISQAVSLSLAQIVIASTIIPALVEEYLKYSVVRFKVIKKSAFDEPIDAMIYCIIAGLGFAAVENLLILFRQNLMPLNEALITIGLRFLGATLIHALASAIVGYFLALSLLNLQKRKRLVFTGLSLAIIFHTCYNYLILTAFGQTESNFKLILLITVAGLIVSTAILVSYFFSKIKTKKSICK